MQLTLRDAATYLGVDEPTVRRWVRERALPVHRFDEKFYLNAVELWEWATAQRIPVSRSLLDQARQDDEDVASLSVRRRAYCGILLLQRCECARLATSHRPVDPRQEFSQHGRFWPFPGDSG